jgi:hypothetical protein
MAQMRRFELLIALGRIGLLSAIDTQGRRIIVFFVLTKEDHSATSAHIIIHSVTYYYVLTAS